MRRVVLVLVSLLIFQIPYANSACVKTASNYTSGSIFENNLINLLYKFKEQSSALKFYSGANGEAPDKVYGLYLCRNDVGIDVCSTCIDGAFRGITGECPFSGEAIVWYDKCMLRYASRDIFSLSETTPALREVNTADIPNYAVFSPVFNSSMRELVKNASSDLPYFAMAKTNWTSNQTFYSYAQCTPDLSVTDCSSCLNTALADVMYCCSKNMGAKILQPSCQLRFETGPFLNDTPSSPASPPPPPLPPAHFPPSNHPPPGDIEEPSLKPAILGAIAGSVSVGLIVLAVVLWICLCRKKPIEESNIVPPASPMALHDDGTEGLGDAEFVQYNFATLKTATGDFSAANTLGKGGFGFVYKGTLESGEQLAIKRLSSTSGQGTKEFMAEARFLAKLQHTNLVKLQGFCLEGDEKLLVYEFMPNSSLERYLFDAEKRPVLDWATRFNIILGIAKGLQYLHEDSRLTIIHRDLKPDNILLDKEMNPKIADFGLAKLLQVVEKRGTTSRIIGTQGYMAPECLMGEFSDKSDVYSFGVMLLEIVSGQNNMKFFQLTKKADLPSHAWRLWKEGRSFELTDPQLDNNCSKEELMRCIQIGLLCLQTDDEKRPKMSSVVYMLMGLGDIPLPSALEMSSPQLSVPIYGGEQRDYTDNYSNKSATMVTDLTRDLYPKPR
ncbi:cysteine-rich receptor-like protein kinase 15 [Silene latifolia]|uniref:cysteine-rich receptor-like protein kinase 15 n=1 Tax=Silene latifolia TaxID=37657 RepID=UPI003D7811A6